MGSPSPETDACSPGALAVISPPRYCLFHCLLLLRIEIVKCIVRRKDLCRAKLFPLANNYKVKKFVFMLWKAICQSVIILCGLLWRLHWGLQTGTDLVWITIRKWCSDLVFSESEMSFYGRFCCLILLLLQLKSCKTTVHYTRKNAENDGPNSSSTIRRKHHLISYKELTSF